MKKLIILFLGPIVIIGLGSCGLFRFNKGTYAPIEKQFSKVEIVTLLQDSLLNVRALEIDEKGRGMFATSRGEIGIIHSSGYLDSLMHEKSPLTAEVHTTWNYENYSINFRSLAITENDLFTMSIAKPALLFKNSSNSMSNLVYQENQPNVFYDSMEFWNDDEGIAIGDPTEDCMSIIITRDGGNSWTKLSCDDLPKAKEGEAAFAASDTNIAIVGDYTWVATGGKASRVLFSSDKGNTWEVYETPISQGLETTGIYSIDFYDEKNGFGIGGDYTKPADSSANKIRTQDGGKTWQLVAKNQSPGYRSCVQYMPNGKGNKLVAVGFNGVDYSNDSGGNWKHLSDEGFYTIRFLNDSVAYAAGKGRVSKLTFKE